MQRCAEAFHSGVREECRRKSSGLISARLFVLCMAKTTDSYFAFDSRHMVLALGRGHNASNVVQTLGRATFNGRTVLNENGFDNVTVLMTSNDLTMCVKIQNYVNHIAYRMQKGDNFAAAMTGANEEIPDTANWIRHTFREPGRIKGTIQ